MKKCPNCGEEISEDYVVCPSCGCLIEEPTYDIEADLED